MLNEIDLSRADLNLLVLFEAVLRERHVGRAAERLNLSASAVSHGLGRLRRLLGDPLFVRTPRGVVPTARAEDLAAPIAAALAQVRAIVGSAAPFDPATSTRRFSIGAPDGVSAVMLPPLLARLRSAAPNIDIAIRQLLPRPAESDPARAWQPALTELESRAVDIAVIPAQGVPARFFQRDVYAEDFVIGVRMGHSFAAAPTLDAYCALGHLFVSQTGDARGFVDDVLAQQGRSRRIALTVPNFLFALGVLGETDFAAALPRRFAARYGPHFGVVGVDPPLALPRFRLSATAPAAALADPGVAWLFDLAVATGPGE